jgi:hypothetical protein
MLNKSVPSGPAKPKPVRFSPVTKPLLQVTPCQAAAPSQADNPCQLLRLALASDCCHFFSSLLWRMPGWQLRGGGTHSVVVSVLLSTQSSPATKTPSMSEPVATCSDAPAVGHKSTMYDVS